MKRASSDEEDAFFYLIDMESWPRREFYEHFIKEVVCDGYHMGLFVEKLQEYIDAFR